MGEYQPHRRQRIRQLEDFIGRRRLIWFGTRGSDAHALMELRQFAACYSQTVPLGVLTLDSDESLEALRESRVDLNDYNIDVDDSHEAGEFHRRLVRECSSPSVLVAYRPAAFLTSAYFPRSDWVEYLGLFHERQAAFEHKPWVESALKAAGVKVIPWRYLCDEDLDLIAEAVRRGPQVLRTNRSSGGAGLTLVHDVSEVPTHWPAHRDGFLALAPYLHPNIPLNISGCVFPNGEITLHAPSLQLIGIDACTGRRFGYCGNDFARIRELDVELLDAFEVMARTTGKWLHSAGYLGAFGIDAVVHKNEVYLTEINPRFQGCSAVAARLTAEMDLPDIFLDHMSAFLGIEPRPTMPVRDLARTQPAISHIICYSRSEVSIGVRPGAPMPSGPYGPSQLPDAQVLVEPEAMLLKLVVPGVVTRDGQSLLPKAQAEVDSALSAFYPVGLTALA